MKRNFITSFIVIFILSSTSAWAIGLGVYGSGSISSSQWNHGHEPNSSDYSCGSGFILDTVVANDELFGYRFKAGYERFEFVGYQSNNTTSLGGFTIRGNKIINSDYPITRINTYHTFEFGLVRDEKVRFWIGPQIGIGYIFGERKLWNYAFILQTINFPASYHFLPYKDKIHYEFMSTSIGLDLGANFNLGEYFTLFLDCGFGYGAYFSMGTHYISNGGKYTLPYTNGSGIGIHGSAGIMFRIHDNFKKRNI